MLTHEVRECPTTTLSTHHKREEEVHEDYARKHRADNEANSTNLHYKPLRPSGQRLEQPPFSQRRDRHGRSFGPRLSTTEDDNAYRNKQISPFRRREARPSPQLPSTTSPADSHSYRRNNSNNVPARDDRQVEDQARRKLRDVSRRRSLSFRAPPAE
ncbi:hypothetical protein F2Q70_00001365 [Brassica cretica]|uniref:Uncharacterized protein n=1 Tax=Brassica cretica TaxID=69181 RepID=A0A8S9J135_BRACR|nr:hypothetical protein F2Q70_00001365 [Brassica cretica]